MPERRHVGRIAIAGIDDQGNETLGHTLLLLALQRRLAVAALRSPVYDAVERALQDRVVGREIALPGAIAFLDTKRIQRLHTEGLEAVLLPRRPDGVEDSAGILDLGMQLPAEFAG